MLSCIVNQLVAEKSFVLASKWVNEDVMPFLRFPHSDLAQLLVPRYKELFTCYLHAENIGEAEEAYQALEKLLGDEATLFVANQYIEKRNFATAFSYYLTVFNNKENPVILIQNAGYELANLIFNGDVILDSAGVLDEESSHSQADFTEEQLKKRKEQGQDLATMQRRAIMAYEYLQNNASLSARALLNYLNQVLSGNMSLSSESLPLWKLNSVKEFQIYYRNKNSNLLVEKSFNDAILHYLEQMSALLSTTNQNNNAGNSAPTFFSPKKQYTIPIKEEEFSKVDVKATPPPNGNRN